MSTFDPDCRACARLASFLDDVGTQFPEYHARPVPPFGDAKAGLLIVGLAPGMHGANATGRPFTGDYAGLLLYRTLHEFGFADAPESLHAQDALKLTACRITNAVKCLPPANKPMGSEIRQCNPFLAEEIGTLPRNAVVIALGKIAHDAVLKALALKLSAHRFGHGREHDLNGRLLLDSYHCSRYNTQTRRLTDTMFKAVFSTAREAMERRGLMEYTHHK